MENIKYKPMTYSECNIHQRINAKGNCIASSIPSDRPVIIRMLIADPQRFGITRLPIKTGKGYNL